MVTDSDTGSGGCHLTEQTGTTRLLGHGRRLLSVSLRRLLVVLLLLMVLLRRGGHGVGTTGA